MADYTHAEIPTRLTGLRACLRCALIKEFSQFYENGCENCDFLNMLGNSDRIYACTTAYFDGTIAVLEPTSSWVAKWQRIASCEPGVYAIELVGELPDDAQEACDNLGIEHRATAKASKT